MTGVSRLRTLVLMSAMALGMGWMAMCPGATEAAGCPARPYTLASVLAVPVTERAACFGRAEISFVARGGLTEAVFPVTVDGRYGQPMMFQGADGSGSLDAWKRADLDLLPADAHALGMTSPGMGLDGWTNVWWRVSGHFDDPIASGCVADANVTPVLTPAEAVAWCRDQFMVDALAWVQEPGTDTMPGASGAAPGRADASVLLSVLGGLAFVAALVRGRRRLGSRSRRGAL